MKGKVLAASAVLAAMMLSTGASAADAEVTLQIGFENSISDTSYQTGMVRIQYRNQVRRNLHRKHHLPV